jgi:hypothetical protein
VRQPFEPFLLGIRRKPLKRFREDFAALVTYLKIGVNKEASAATGCR